MTVDHDHGHERHRALAYMNATSALPNAYAQWLTGKRLAFRSVPNLLEMRWIPK